MNFRPLKVVAAAINKVFGIQTFPSISYQGWRGRVQHFAIGLAWLSKGYQYDDRTLWQRLTGASGWAHIRFAFTGRFR